MILARSSSLRALQILQRDTDETQSISKKYWSVKKNVNRVFVQKKNLVYKKPISSNHILMHDSFGAFQRHRFINEKVIFLPWTISMWQWQHWHYFQLSHYVILHCENRLHTKLKPGAIKFHQFCNFNIIRSDKAMRYKLSDHNSDVATS